MSALFPVPFGQGSAPPPSNYIRRLVQLLSSYARPKRLFARSSSPLVLGPVPADYPPRYLIRLLSRTCVKSRFPRLGAPIPPLDGFLHDNVIICGSGGSRSRGP